MLKPVLKAIIYYPNRYAAFEVVNNSNDNNLFAKEDEEPVIVKREILNSILRRDRNRVTH